MPTLSPSDLVQPWEPLLDGPPCGFADAARPPAFPIPVPPDALSQARRVAGLHEGSSLWVPDQRVRSGAMRLSDGRSLSFDGPDAWVFFVDLHPIALWAHPCLYVVVADGLPLQIVESHFHPMRESVGPRFFLESVIFGALSAERLPANDAGNGP